jgi:hypothetical protein
MLGSPGLYCQVQDALAWPLEWDADDDTRVGVLRTPNALQRWVRLIEAWLARARCTVAGDPVADVLAADRAAMAKYVVTTMGAIRRVMDAGVTLHDHLHAKWVRRSRDVPEGQALWGCMSYVGTPPPARLDQAIWAVYAHGALLWKFLNQVQAMARRLEAGLLQAVAQLGQGPLVVPVRRDHHTRSYEVKWVAVRSGGPSVGLVLDNPVGVADAARGETATVALRAYQLPCNVEYATEIQRAAGMATPFVPALAAFEALRAARAAHAVVLPYAYLLRGPGVGALEVHVAARWPPSSGKLL